MGKRNEECVGLLGEAFARMKRLSVSPVLDQLLRNNARVTIGNCETQLIGRILGSLGSVQVTLKLVSSPAFCSTALMTLPASGVFISSQLLQTDKRNDQTYFEHIDLALCCFGISAIWASTIVPATYQSLCWVLASSLDP
jgi:hypothetical protein